MRYIKDYLYVNTENDIISLTAVDGKEYGFLTSDIDDLIKFYNCLSDKLHYYVVFTNDYSQTVRITEKQYTELKEYLADNQDMINWSRKDSYRPKLED